MDIGLSKPLGASTLRKAFRDILPGLDVQVVLDMSELPERWDLWVYVVEGSDEFPTGLMMAVPYVDGCDESGWLRDVARALSERLGVRSLSDGTPYGPVPSPYWSLIWDAGVPYLADDSEYPAEDDDEGGIRIVEALDPVRFPRRSAAELVACVAVRDRPG